MSKHITLSSYIPHDKFVQFVYDKLDIQPTEYSTVKIPFNMDDIETFEWNIGLICGNSGSGKTTILNELGEVYVPCYDYNKCVISQFEKFGMSPEEASEFLFNVGLSSIPTWLHKPNQLSNGEKARLDIAMQLANAVEGDTVFIDEWTSVVNRDVAKSMSNSIQKLIRKRNLKVVFVSCHFDIIDWLQCDWIYNLNKVPCQVERMVYSDDAQYEVYKSISSNVTLSEEIAL